MRFNDLVVEAVTFADVQRALGPAHVRNVGGDAAEFMAAACYVGQDESTLTFLSNEMGGGTTITGIELTSKGAKAKHVEALRRLAAEDRQPACASTEQSLSSLKTAGGIGLGLDVKNVIRLAGAPTEDRGDVLVFRAEAKIPMMPDQAKRLGSQGHPFFLRIQRLQVEFANGRVSAIRAWQITST